MGCSNAKTVSSVTDDAGATPAKPLAPPAEAAPAAALAEAPGEEAPAAAEEPAKLENMLTLPAILVQDGLQDSVMQQQMEEIEVKPPKSFMQLCCTA